MVRDLSNGMTVKNMKDSLNMVNLMAKEHFNFLMVKEYKEYGQMDKMFH